MTNQINAPNVFIAVLGAVGILVLYISFTIRQGSKLLDEDIASGRVREKQGGGLQARIDQAGLEITAGQFLRIGGLIGLGCGLLFSLLTGVPAGFLLGLGVGFVGYWSYLTEKRDKYRQQYQSALGEVVSLLKEGFLDGNSLEPAVEHVLKYGPDIILPDFRRLNAHMAAKESTESALRELADRRRDPILDVVVETLIINHKNQGKISPVLDSLLETVRERVRIRRRIKGEQSQPMWQLRIMSVMPFLATIMLRGIAPEYPAFWSGGIGQLSLLFAWGLAVAGYFAGMRFVTRATAIAESFGITDEKVKGGQASRSGGTAVPHLTQQQSQFVN